MKNAILCFVYIVVGWFLKVLGKAAQISEVLARCDYPYHDLYLDTCCPKCKK